MRLFHNRFTYLVWYECKSCAVTSVYDRESLRFVLGTGTRRRLYNLQIYGNLSVVESVDKKQLHRRDRYATPALVKRWIEYLRTRNNRYSRWSTFTRR